MLDFNNVSEVRLSNSVELKSDNSNVLVNTKVTGIDSKLTIDASSISLGETHVKELNLTKINSEVQLNGDIVSQSTINFANNTLLNLNQDTNIQSSGRQVLSGLISGGFNLTLDSNKQRIDLNEVNTKSLTITNSGDTYLNSDINTSGNVDLSDVLNIILNSDIKIESLNENINLSAGIDSFDKELKVITSNDIKLGTIRLKELLVTADKLSLDGDVTTVNDLIFNQVNQLTLGSDLTIESLSGQVDLSQGINSSSHSLKIQSLSDIKLSASELKDIELTSDSVQISGDFTTTNNFKVTASTTNIDGDIGIVSLGDIDFSLTALTGNDLNLTAGNGEVKLDNTQLDSLRISANKVKLLNDIQTESVLDLNGAVTVVLENSVSLKSNTDSILLNTQVDGGLHNLTLDSNSAELGTMNVKKLEVVSNSLQINDDITAKNDIDLSNTVSTVINGVNTLESTHGNVQLKQTSLTGDELNIKAGNGLVNVGDVNLSALKITSDQAFLSDNIETTHELNLSPVNTIILESDLSLKSHYDDIKIDTYIDGQSYNLDFSAKEINLGSGIVNKLNVTGDSIYLSGDITSQNDIEFITTNKTSINGVRQLESVSGSIDVKESKLVGDDLTLKALNGSVKLGAADLQSLIIYAQNSNLFEDINTKYLLDLNNSATVVLNDSITLKSSLDDIAINTELNGEQYDLSLDASKVTLGQTSVNNLSVAPNSKLLLNGDVVTKSNFNLSDTAIVELINDAEISSLGDQIILGKIKGNFNLSLINLNSGQMDINLIDVGSLNINNAGVTNLYGNVTAQDNINFSQTNQLNLRDNIEITSTNDTIQLNQELLANNFDLSITSDVFESSNINSVNSFEVDAQTMLLSGDIHSSNTIDLSRVETLNVLKDFKLDSLNTISLAKKVISDLNSSVVLKADVIDINKLGITGYEVGNVKLVADNVNLNDQIMSMSHIDLSQTTNLHINGPTEINSSTGNGSIDLSQTHVSGNNSGDQLLINSGNNNVALLDSQTDTLQIISNQTDLYGSISTKGALDLSNSKSVYFHNNTKLHSEGGHIALDTNVNAESIDLDLDALSIDLGTNQKTISVNKLDISRKGSSINLYGSIDADSNIIFYENSLLALNEDTVISSKGDITLASNVIGPHKLSLSSIDNNIKLNNLDIDDLMISNASKTDLNGYIKLINNVDLSSSQLLQLTSDVLISSQYGDVNLDTKLQGKSHHLEVDAAKQIVFEELELGSVSAMSQVVRISGNNISTQDSLDLSQTETIKVFDDITFSSSNGHVSLADIQLQNDVVDISIDASQVSLQKISDNKHFASSINIDASVINLTNDILSSDEINMANSHIKLNGNITLKTNNGSINLDKTNISGNTSSLNLSANKGNISLGEINTIHSLNILTPGYTHLSGSIKTFYDQNYSQSSLLTGSAVNLYSHYGNIITNNINSNAVQMHSYNNISILGDIISTNNINSYVKLESINNQIILDKNSKINSSDILLKAKNDISIGHLKGKNVELRSLQGSINIIPSNNVNIVSDNLILSAFDDIGTYFSPVNIDVNYLKIEKAETAVINGQFKVQDVNGNTQFILPELEFLASSKDYTLNVNDFTVIDSGLFMQGINLFSISDDAVLMNDDSEELYINNESVNEDLTINMK
ncbi:MAG: hypothetical protein GY694_08390 [Gammaproteobacteria bacterium]|nr:hypothetical protein [Gammaproteobacteria bacterium]